MELVNKLDKIDPVRRLTFLKNAIDSLQKQIPILVAGYEAADVGAKFEPEQSEDAHEKFRDALAEFDASRRMLGSLGEGKQIHKHRFVYTGVINLFRCDDPSCEEAVVEKTNIELDAHYKEVSREHVIEVI